MLRTLLVALVVLVAVAVGILYAAGRGSFGDHEEAGQPAHHARPAGAVERVAAAQAAAAGEIGVAQPKQVLFGDLHVHTTFSFDAFTFSLPVLAGEGAHPPADACDFARHCSALDFWSINDHAFGITPRHWRETVESVRQCNAISGDASNPDTVAFLGWEWTQVGPTPEEHYGHKNVVLRDTDEDRIPRRPIASRSGVALGGNGSVLGRGMLAVVAGGRYHDFMRYLQERADARRCDVGVPVRDLPDDCIESAATPAELYAKLDDWGHASIVIPHGTTWGFYTPPGSTWDKQLVGDMHDPERQTLIEVYSGHGDSEVYRDWRAVEIAEDGSATCPAPRDDYLPSCWRAGEIIRERCLAEGADASECEARASEARIHAAEAGVAVHRTVPGATGADFLDAGQCRDCEEPAFNYRPGGSAQYISAIANFDEEDAAPRHFRMGFMASSDNHYARPGTGYKEVHRSGFTESQTPPSERNAVSDMLAPEPDPPASRSRPFTIDQPGFDVFETERQASFLTTGGLVAVHASGRDRGAIWDALESREVYGTSGPRILLWFDLLNPPGSRGEVGPMGSEVEMDAVPIFRVRAVGSFEQKPGCPASAEAALGAADLDRICKGECYHPGETRRPITRIEVTRIRPQQRPDEDLAALIDDPWRSFTCDGDPAGCAVTFSDPDYVDAGRGTLYYARAYEAPRPTINGDNLRCETDAEGRCVRIRPCPEPGPDAASDDCLGEAEPRAWSSPIWVDWPAAAGG